MKIDLDTGHRALTRGAVAQRSGSAAVGAPVRRCAVGTRRLRLACAESCTGGLIASTCTAIPGSSDWFECAFVTYRLAAKQRLLDVSDETLRRWGAVSEPTAKEMALGALQHCDADIAVSVTGVAGPSGGDVANPVGTVWFAWALRSPNDIQVVQTARHDLRWQPRADPSRRRRNRADGRARLSRFGVIDSLHCRDVRKTIRGIGNGGDRRTAGATRSSSSTTVVGRVRSIGAALVRQSSSFTKCPACIRW